MKPQRGFGAIVAIVVVVVLAAMGVAILKFGWGQQMGSAQDVQGARASQVAIAGAEWGLYQALRGSWSTCAGASQTLDLRSETGFAATVTCNSDLYDEGESSPGVPNSARFYQIQAVACTSATCPDNTQATPLTYVERVRLAVATNK